MKNIFYKLSVRNKLMVVLLPLVSLFIIITGTVCYFLSSAQLKINSEKLLEDAVHQASVRLEERFKIAYSAAISLTNSESLKYFTFVYDGETMDKEFLINNQELKQQITRICVDYPDVMDSVVFKTKHDYSLSYSSYASPYVITESFGEMLKKVRIEQRGELFRYAWRSLHEEDLLPTSRKRNVISLYCVAGNENSDAGMLLVINMLPESVAGILRDITTSRGSVSGILAEDSVLYDGAEKKEVLREEDREKLLHAELEGSYISQDLNGEKILISYERLQLNGWVIFSAVPLNSLMAGNEFIGVMIAVCVVIMLLVSSVPIIVFSRYMSDDIKRIACQLEQYEAGDKTIIFETKDEKEIGELVDGLNTFVATINCQISTIEDISEKKRKAELLLLQSQINPHFLYNTLISIQALINAKDYDRVSKMYESVVRFYVLSLSKGMEKVKISGELDLIRHYLTILQMRYDNSFEWCMNVDDEILNCEIPKLTLQPIVENAIDHGLRRQSKKGILDISGCRFEDKVILTVWDNGGGISENKLAELNQYIKMDAPGDKEVEHFGLWNCNQRIELYYGKEYGIELESVESSYTSTLITLPYTGENGGEWYDETFDC
ncbi:MULTISPECIES: sensor histidine kinase [Hungatella]|uniref:Sensor histidine kinase n=1 Tax=Hungatella hathewayi TaxID=154046 RepID=A0AAW9WG73_9FIRM|nr:histidine kinase [Hungatella hathewayi]MCQ4828150.1 histidine kinase [Hungatella sp. SL.1.14]MUB62952.1 sensor histidine kinase [Hungatella hathewayi]CUP32066.1 integral membrane sensor signal transduction histidine kinase [Hungatella hathewayi]